MFSLLFIARIDRNTLIIMYREKKETLVVDLFLDGRLFKKEVRIPLVFYLYDSSFLDYFVLSDGFQTTLMDMYKPSPLKPSTQFTTKWYVASSRPSEIKWASVSSSTNPFESKVWDREFDIKQYQANIKGKYLAFNLTLGKQIGLSCANCEKGATFVHMEHDIETDLRTPIDAYCSHACFEQGTSSS